MAVGRKCLKLAPGVVQNCQQVGHYSLGGVMVVGLRSLCGSPHSQVFKILGGGF
jgi:hypothetical protein